MQRIFSVIPKSVGCANNTPPIVIVAAAAGVDVLDSVAKVTGEFVGRYIQNVGANALNYAFDNTASDVQYNGQLAAGLQLDCSNHGCRVSVYSAAGTTIARTILVNNDNIQQISAAIGSFNIP